MIPLNEGRGRDPGDTGQGVPLQHVVVVVRSTKAGAETPATQVEKPPFGSGVIPRSTKAGAETPATPGVQGLASHDGNLAQRRPGPRPRRHYGGLIRDDRVRVRSTKAGAETPATRGITPRRWAWSTSLNEGRGRDPGDTPTRGGRVPPGDALNEGRGRDPGDTGPGRVGSLHDRPLNEGRGRDPGDT